MADLLNKKIKSFRLSRGQTTVKQIAFIIIAILLFIGLAWFIGFKEKKDLIYLASLLEKENKKLEMPIGFPKDLPLLKPNNVSQAYLRDQETKDITIAIESKKSVKENYDYYLAYGKKNGWQIDEARQATDKSPGKLLLRKDKLILSFSFKDKEKGDSEIIISSTVFNLTVDKLGLPRFIGPPIQQEKKIPAKAGQTPEGFPESFPLNGKTEITQAYALKTENQSGVVYAVKFKSDQTKSTNIKFYQDWFKENNWFLGEQKSEGESTLITASKPFVNSVEVEIVKLSDSISEIEVKWREFR